MDIIEQAKKVATNSVKEAGAILMDHLEEVKNRSFKSKHDIVTEIDLKSEKLMCDNIKANFPDHSILSEEKGFADHHSKYIWVMDPIDGTINYYYGASPFRVGLCLLKDKEPIITALYNPVKDQLYFAEKGHGATLNGKPIKISNISELSEAVVMTHFSSKKEARARTIVSLEKVFKETMQIRVFGSGLASMCYVAQGQFDIFVNVKTNPWDILPGSLLVEEAGGIVTDIKGNKITYESDSVLATSGKVHQETLKLLEDM